MRACGGVVYTGIQRERVGGWYLSAALLSVLFQVNENFAIDLIAEQPVETKSVVVICAAAGGPGPPRVYINLVTCCPDPGPSLFSPRWLHTLARPAQPSWG